RRVGAGGGEPRPEPSRDDRGRGVPSAAMDLAPKAASAFLHVSRAVFRARRAISGGEPAASTRPARPTGAPRRNVLFVTSDQQRFDSLAITGHPFAKTPALDALARSGVLYRRAHVQNVVCMPSRTTMLTGQHPLTHGVVANGISAPEGAP